MPLNSLLPQDQELVARLPYWIRQTRAAISPNFEALLGLTGNDFGSVYFSEEFLEEHIAEYEIDLSLVPDEELDLGEI